MIAWIARRVRDKARREPWWIVALAAFEASSSATLVVWGANALHLGSLDGLPSYDVLTRHFSAAQLAATGIATGSACLVVTLLDFRRSRWFAAFAMCFAWHGLAWGINNAQAGAPASVVYFAWGLVNVPTLILLRPRSALWRAP